MRIPLSTDSGSIFHNKQQLFLFGKLEPPGECPQISDGLSPDISPSSLATVLNIF
jgi:hypothetical protein